MSNAAPHRSDPPRKSDHGDPLPAPARDRRRHPRRAAGRVESVERAQAARHHDRARPAGPRVRRPALRLLPRRQGRRRQPLGAAAAGADVLRRLARFGDGGAAGLVRDTVDRSRAPPAECRCSSADARMETNDEHLPVRSRRGAGVDADCRRDQGLGVARPDGARLCWCSAVARRRPRATGCARWQLPACWCCRCCRWRCRRGTCRCRSRWRRAPSWRLRFEPPRQLGTAPCLNPALGPRASAPSNVETRDANDDPRPPGLGRRHHLDHRAAGTLRRGRAAPDRAPDRSASCRPTAGAERNRGRRRRLAAAAGRMRAPS